MTGNEALEAIDAVLERYYRGIINPYEALNQIAQINGQQKAQP